MKVWVIAAVAIAAVTATFGTGYRMGGATCRAEQEATLVIGRVAAQRELDTATRASLKVRDITQRLRIDLVSIEDTTRAVVAEVTHDTVTAPALSGCVVPDRTRQLRQQQVDDSAARAATGHAM